MTANTYIHIPFCKRKCKYCSFVSGKSLEYKEKYINALIFEIKQRYKKEQLKTLYFGGGTPSLLDGEDLKKIIECFNFSQNPEITIEVNPESVEINKFKQLKEIGFNRISLGVQTFDNEILKLIGRNHTKQDINNAINIIKKAAFENISIDLIYGLPNQNFDILKNDLKYALELDIQHISTYGLKIEPDSSFWETPPDNLPNEDTQAEMFIFLCEFLKKNQYEHYEISNFCKKGYESKHNISYWENKNYYGFGLNASGFENDIRYKNTSDIKEYINNPLKREEENIISKKENMENEIFLALRLKNGINITEIEKKYSINFQELYGTIINKYKQAGLLTEQDKHLKLTEKGILLSNEIMAEFIL